MDELKSRRMDNFADGHQEKGLEGLRSQGDVKRERLEERRREAARYRDAYIYFLNQRRLEERRSAEGLTDDQSKQWRKDLIDDQSKQWRIEQDHIDDQGKQSQFRENLTQIQQQQKGEYLARMRLRQGDKLFTEKIEQLFQKDVLGQALEENKDKLFKKSKFEGINEQENADSTTSKTTQHSKNPNSSDPFFDGISTEQVKNEIKTFKDLSSSPDSKTSTREGPNPQWHVDQATSYNQSEFVHSKLDDSKSTEADATKRYDAQEHSKQKAEAEAKFTSTDDLYTNAEAIEVIRAFFESKEGKIMLEREYNFARTQKEFLDSGAARVDSEKVGIDNPQKIMKSMQREIDEYRLRLANVIDPKLVQLGEVQKEEYYRCLKDLDRCLTTANNYMRNMIDVTKSKTKFSSNTPQRSTPPLVHAVA